MRIAILGAGVMGTALTIPLSKNNNQINLWGTKYDEEAINSMINFRKHPKLSVEIPKLVKAFSSYQIDEALKESEIVVISVSSNAVESIIEEAAPYIPEKAILMIVSKGFEVNDKGEIKFLPNIVKEKVKGKNPIVSIRGPSIANEVAFEIPTMVIFASKNFKAMEKCKKAFETSFYKIYLTKDVIGVEVCSSIKNIYAIGLGFCDGLEKKTGKSFFNTRSALLTLSLLEMAELTKFFGGSKETAYGLAGLGDLDVTSKGGRNRMFGELIGKGLSVNEALNEMKGMTIEGYEAAEKTLKLKLNKPLLNTINSILFKNEEASIAINKLFQ
ncbi:NAD(P)H-dependent glycerol-3-phosphate dehydrogenase [Candidatus Bathyarchaeota archaeon]|nr:NAD(P)H-dependent glycerol-3-phosphate dehydrogenase [Candidatus Bathyarchaeota archaeon]